jgi:hypothetical protein
MNHVKLLIEEKSGELVNTFGFAYTDKSQEVKWVDSAVVATRSKDNKWSYKVGSKVGTLSEEQYATFKHLLEKVTQYVETNGMNLAGIKVEKPKADAEKAAK